jgi:methyltransferase (TIGR00027 family)
MHEGRPSRTALRVALRRAAHQLVDHPKVFDDPLAIPILGPAGGARLQREMESAATPYARAMRAFMAVRSRHAEDLLHRAVARGVGRYAVLGAGLDTFAYRNPYPVDHLQVFEVDHPATQAWKRGCLEEAGIAVPAGLTFAPVDFESQTLADGLRAAGFRDDEPAFFSWLGVVPYLTREAIRATLRYVAALPAGSEIVFDYGIPPDSLDPRRRQVFDALAERVAAAGEPWRTFYEPAALVRELGELGFGDVEDTGPEAIDARYFADRTDGLRMGGLGHLMRARVGEELGGDGGR